MCKIVVGEGNASLVVIPVIVEKISQENERGGGLFRDPPLIPETTGPILKIQAAFESPRKIIEGKLILMTSGSPVTSQVRSKSECSTFRAW